MTNLGHNPDNYCYRHPDRQSFVLCQRCGRTICAQCQTQAAVGVHCPECVREAQGNMPRVKPVSVTRSVGRVQSLVASGGPIATYTLMGLSLLGYLLHFIPAVTSGGLYAGVYTLHEPWRLVTGIFLHANLLQVAFNMFSIFIFGRMLEAQLGWARFAALFLLSGLGGEVALSLFAPLTGYAGSNPAIFGIFAAFFVIQRHLGNQAVQLLVILGLNIVIALVLGGAWQAYLGGIVIGAATASIMMQTRDIRSQSRQRIYLIALAVVLVLITLVRAATFGSVVG
ncbi:rhomboid family intramembrane serine protease [Frondihabitans cladoniiphilus]|uniref:Rhomboid family intramembrane serine protease n=1 Tax=Frondihabitans cladoniiphilus TaxID=715785 RepID=A0ABP8W131_9MICO